MLNFCFCLHETKCINLKVCTSISYQQSFLILFSIYVQFGPVVGGVSKPRPRGQGIYDLGDTNVRPGGQHGRLGHRHLHGGALRRRVSSNEGKGALHRYEVS